MTTDPNPTAYQLPADSARLAQEEPRLERRFWRKLRRALGHLPLAETFLSAFYAAIDPKTPAGAKAILLGAIGYFIIPIDMIPDVMGALGYSDDLAVLLAAIRAVEGSITDIHREKAKAWLERMRQGS